MKVFIDASVVLAALGSETGGSSEVLKLVMRHKLVGATSQSVIEEVMRNAGKIKVSESAVAKLLSSSFLEIIAAPTATDVEKYSEIVDEKDAHVVASAIESKADFILTLDKKHLLSKRVGALKIVTPGEFLKNL